MKDVKEGVDWRGQEGPSSGHRWRMRRVGDDRVSPRRARERGGASTGKAEESGQGKDTAGEGAKAR